MHKKRLIRGLSFLLALGLFGLSSTDAYAVSVGTSYEAIEEYSTEVSEIDEFLAEAETEENIEESVQSEIESEVEPSDTVENSEAEQIQNISSNKNLIRRNNDKLEFTELEKIDISDAEMEGVGAVNPSLRYVQPRISLDEVNLRDMSNWQSGSYDPNTVLLTEYPTRISLKEYVSVKAGDKYKLLLSNPDYRVLVKVVDKTGTIILSKGFSNQDILEIGDNAAFAAITFCRIDNNASYSHYKSFFNAGGNVRLVNQNKPNITELSDIDLSDFSNWVSGGYEASTGNYAACKTRVCIDKDIRVTPGKKYSIVLKDQTYHLLIREKNLDGKVVKSYDTVKSQTYTPSSKTYSIIITLYKTGDNTTYSSFKTSFSNGYLVKIVDPTAEPATKEPATQEPATKEPATQEPATKEPVTQEPATKEPATQEPATQEPSTEAPVNNEVTAYDKALQMLVDGNADAVDFSEYKLTKTDFASKVWNRLLNESYLEVRCYYRPGYSLTTSGNYVKTVKFNNIDSEGPTRIANARKHLATYLSMVKPQMNDVEKLLLAHEYIADITEYVKEGNISHTAGGPLGRGKGVCDGYSHALRVLLHYVGIETADATSTAMNHGWAYVKINNKWYNVDVTWDDYLSSVYNQCAHSYILKNDQELKNDYQKYHDWISYDMPGLSSTSTDFSNWFVHNVYGSMRYYNGMWYYWDKPTNSIVCSDINGNSRRVVIDGSNRYEKLKVDKITNGVLTYYIGSQMYEMRL